MIYYTKKYIHPKKKSQFLNSNIYATNTNTCKIVSINMLLKSF